MTLWQALLGTLLLFALLWMAYTIGKVLLRIAVGLIFLGLVAYAVWRFVLN